ncbi:MAG: PhoH family protein [Candidatus Omnitrophota bacterium]
MQKIIVINDLSSLQCIFGVADENLKFLEKELSVAIAIKPKGIQLKGSKDKVNTASSLLNKIVVLGNEGFVFSQKELSQYLNSHSLNSKRYSLKKEEAISDSKLGIRVPSARKKLVFPKTAGQKEYLEAMRKYDIVFATGPAGTGKTYLAMAMAVNSLMKTEASRIVLTRPALEAGESLGFLPGDMHAKLGPYLRPLYDALYDMMESEVIEGYLETGIIEIVPLAYMRGRTLNNAFVVLDEAQNCTSEQLKMFLTRLGFDSKAVITGDITQSDLPGGQPTGLKKAIQILKAIKGIHFINLGKKDVVRHPLIQEIIQAYENFYSKTGN